MSHAVLDVIVIGAGQAGLSASYFLKKYGLDHLVFERGAVGESWRSQRWDSFLLNSANKLNALPGNEYTGNDPDGFCSAREFSAQLRNYATVFQLPVMEHTTVIAVERPDNIFKITVSKNEHIHVYHSRQVVIASGEMSEKHLPEMANHVIPPVTQLHAGDYRRPSQLPEGGVLVVGSAQSGVQIAEELAVAGRRVYLSTSAVPRVPRRYRGRDIMDWLLTIGFFDARKEEVKDPAMLHMKAPQLTGLDRGTRTISLQALAQKGVQIMGRLDHIEGDRICLQPNAARHVKLSDEFSMRVKQMIDGYIARQHLPAPPPDIDPADAQDVYASCVTEVACLSFKTDRISAIIWATGFTGKFDYIRLPVLDADGTPENIDGLSPVEGLYFLGLHWLRSRRSVLINGIAGDAAFICSKVVEHSDRTKTSAASV